jgi:hypothetical protein
MLRNAYQKFMQLRMRKNGWGSMGPIDLIQPGNKKNTEFPTSNSCNQGIIFPFSWLDDKAKSACHSKNAVTFSETECKKQMGIFPGSKQFTITYWSHSWNQIKSGKPK